MNTSSKALTFIVTLILCQCLLEVECRRTTSTSRRGQTSRRNNYGSSHQGSTSSSTGIFSSIFGSKKPSASSGSSGSTTVTKKSGTGWTASQPSRTSGTSSGQSGSWANPYYKPSAPPKQTGTYGWVPGNTQQSNQFQRGSQPSSNIGSAGYPVQSGYQPAGRTQQGFGTAQQPHGYNTAQQPHGFNTGQQSHGYNPASQPHSYNTGQQPHGYNTGQHGYNPHPSYSQPSYHGSNVGGYQPSPNIAPQGYASSHGISPSYYPTQSNFGYPGQGLSAGSQGPKYGGLSLFNGGGGSYGYGNNHWGVPSYGAKSSSGTGKLLTGLALGAGAGYLTSSLVNRVSSPWGYSGWGYGNRYGYDRPIVIKEIRETTKTTEPASNPAQEPPDPKDSWISCVAFDAAMNQTFINPNCSCTVTTTIDPMTGLPISTHNCTTANGQVLPPVPFGAAPQMPVGPQPPMDMLPPNAVNNPNATPNYGGLYTNMRYGAGPEAMAPMGATNVENASLQGETTIPPSSSSSLSPSSTETSPSSSTASEPASSSSTTEAMMGDSPKLLQHMNNPKVKEFYSKLEQITNMGKFN